MKQSGFIIFFSIVFTLYTLLNVYIVRRGLQALPEQGWPRILFLGVMLLLILTYPLGRICERCVNVVLGDILLHIGAYYLAVMVFAFFSLIIIDVLRLGNHFLHLFPQNWRGFHSPTSMVLFLITSLLISGLTVAGAINARSPRIRHLSLAIEKASPLKTLRLVLATDIHLGTLMHASRMQSLAERMNAQSPDIILLGGDIFDEDVLSLDRQNMSAVLRQLDAPYGVYAIPGNHEYFSGIEKAVEYMQSAGIIVLRDRAVKVADAFYVIGRDDRQARSFGVQRKSLSGLLDVVDKTMPLILLDHQPFNLEEAETAGIDLQLSGHTHHGQLAPFNWITNLVYEVSWGYKRKGRTHIYVSCGAGTWGPPVRLGSRPEIVVIDLNFSFSRPAADDMPSNHP